ncbi:MAG TPA: hypothetical protein VGE67_03875 [Haloferula sp.]
MMSASRQSSRGRMALSRSALPNLSITAFPRSLARSSVASSPPAGLVSRNPSGHAVYFNYAFGVMAIDAERRNCYLTDGELQPFDVILCHPHEELEQFLRIYPED